ncbi:MAG: modulated transcriptional regulator, MtlR family [Firmicutes bacterium]|nr:modulated transcriptional regulator, MtlR family [Bacillota bacterium]
MINCVKKIGPYIVIAPGIAMPHSRPEDGVKKICLSMVRLATPVSFSSLKNDPVDLVFAFGAVDYESHFRVLSELWQILNDPSAIKILRSCKDKTQILALASCYSAKSVDE